MRRLAPVLSAWLVVLSVAAAGACAGWQPTASARRACCAASQHSCGSQMAADTCCGQSEQAQQPGLHGILVCVAAPSIAVAAVVTVPDVQGSSLRAAAATFERTIQQRPHSPPSFLSSVLLI